MSIDVYLSYSRDERGLAERFASGLGALGFDVWWDAELAPGSSFDVEISRHLREAKAVIVLWSQRSANSSWVRSEASIAHRDRKLLPVLADAGANVPLEFQSIYTVVYRNDIEQTLRDLLPALQELTGKSAQLTPATQRQKSEKQNRGFAFLSYSEEDADFRNRLVEFLRLQNFAYWEYGESDRDYDMLLFLELEKRIAESTLVLSILSESWKKSVWCVKEYFFAKEAAKPVFLLRAKPLGPTLAIAGEHYINFDKDEKKGFERLAKEMKRRGL